MGFQITGFERNIVVWFSLSLNFQLNLHLQSTISLFIVQS